MWVRRHKQNESPFVQSSRSQGPPWAQVAAHGLRELIKGQSGEVLPFLIASPGPEGYELKEDSGTF